MWLWLHSPRLHETVYLSAVPTTFPQLAQFSDLAFLLLRLIVGIIFLSSGWNHLRHSEARRRSIEMSKGFTIFLGMVEVAGSLGVIFAVLIRLAALGLILVLLGAIQKKFLSGTPASGERKPAAGIMT